MALVLFVQSVGTECDVEGVVWGMSGGWEWGRGERMIEGREGMGCLVCLLPGVVWGLFSLLPPLPHPYYSQVDADPVASLKLSAWAKQQLEAAAGVHGGALNAALGAMDASLAGQLRAMLDSAAA